jgi:hypothetical protein
LFVAFATLIQLTKRLSKKIQTDKKKLSFQ